MSTKMSPRMTPSTASRTLVVARIGLTIAAFVLVSCSADHLTSEQKVASLNQAVPTGEQQCAGDASPQTVFLEDADGNAFQLVHCRGSGWKYVAGGKSDDGEGNLAIRKIEFSPISAAQAGTPALPTDDPMAVFIDGPTGYTFAWTNDGGWKFVGHIADEKH